MRLRQSARTAGSPELSISPVGRFQSSRWRSDAVPRSTASAPPAAAAARTGSAPGTDQPALVGVGRQHPERRCRPAVLRPPSGEPADQLVDPVQRLVAVERRDRPAAGLDVGAVDAGLVGLAPGPERQRRGRRQERERGHVRGGGRERVDQRSVSGPEPLDQVGADQAGAVVVRVATRRPGRPRAPPRPPTGAPARCAGRRRRPARPGSPAPAPRGRPAPLRPRAATPRPSVR